MVTLAGTTMGRLSLASSEVGCDAFPTTTIWVPGTAKLPATCRARVTVLKLHAGVARVPTNPLPVALTSLPFTGSTKYLLPVTAEQPVQVLFTHAFPEPQSLSVQQLPDVHRPPQQKSPPLAAQAPLALQTELTQVPAPAPPAVWQMVLDPYVASVWHCASVEHGPQVLDEAAPQIWPALAAVQSALVPWQLPGWQMPWKQMLPPP